MDIAKITTTKESRKVIAECRTYLAYMKRIGKEPPRITLLREDYNMMVREAAKIMRRTGEPFNGSLYFDGYPVAKAE